MATDPRVETIALLKRIAVAVEMIAGVRAAPPAAERVPDALLSGPYGDPQVKAKDPRDWAGPSMIGKHFSECPPEYLDLLADRYDYFAGKEPDATKAGYNRKDAQRARGWAQRLRSGWPAPAHVPSAGEPEW